MTHVHNPLDFVGRYGREARPTPPDDDQLPAHAALRHAVHDALRAHSPAGKDYAQKVKSCTCGHTVPIHDMAARTQHLEDVVVEALLAHPAAPAPTFGEVLHVATAALDEQLQHTTQSYEAMAGAVLRGLHDAAMLDYREVS